MSSRPSIAVVGSVNLDLVAHVAALPRPGETVAAARFERVPGGKGANQAVAAARLGADVTFIGCVGVDWLATEALAILLEEENVEVQVVTSEDASTGTATILVDDEGENVIVIAAGANAELRPEHVNVTWHAAALCQLEVPLETVAAAAEQALYFALNTAPARRVPQEILDQADLVVANRYELEALGSEPKRLLAVTLGSEGAVLYDAGQEVARAAPPVVDAVDGTAAGDAFTACLLVSLLEGLGHQWALERACAAGAVAASRPGAQPSLPYTVDVDELLGKAKP
jgi:ribokinase